MYTLLVDVPLWMAFLTALALSWGLTLFGFPGNWMIVALAGLAMWLAPADSRLAVAPAVWGVLIALAVAGEIVELATGSAAAKRAGGTRRGALGAIGGAFLGALAGAILGLPVPVVGSALAAILFGAGGALVGAAVMEMHAGQSLPASLRIGHAAFWGRLLGTLAKAVLGAIMVVIAAVSVTL